MTITVNAAAIEEASKKLSNWGRWGKDDMSGTLNHVTPQDIVEAGRLIRQGKVFALGIPLDRTGPQTGLFGGRFNPIHQMLATGTDALTGQQDWNKLRYADHEAIVDFRYDNLLPDFFIAPMIFIPFVENAFKHGVANDPAEPIKLIINLSDGHLSFYMENKKHMNNRDTISGIGLSNVKRRLDLLYPERYNLEIHDDTDMYTCELSLIL